MKILLDSNIIMRITDVRTPLPPVYAELVRLANSQRHDLCYHPGSILDMRDDPQDDRKEINLTRVRQYQALENPPMPTAQAIRKFGWSTGSRNNDVDNGMLYAVVRGATDVLITEDKRMHGKAERAGIADVVFYIDDFIEQLLALEKKKGRPPTEFLKIETRRMQDIDLGDVLFDSLRISYPEFNRWYRKSAAAGRNAWVVYGPMREIVAICIYKEEVNPNIGKENSIIIGRVLKLCTFKVSGRGDKLGERLLDYAFHFAADNRYVAVYMQIRDGGDATLIRLVTAFGFSPLSRYMRDISYVKPMVPDKGVNSSSIPDENLQFAIRHFPYFFGGANVRKFLVPIRPTFHDLLFPETVSQNMLFVQAGQSFPSETNAICKAYVCRSRISLIRPGDLLFFYRSKEGKFVECVGVVETAEHSADKQHVLDVIARRTVFSDNQISREVEKGSVLVLRFRLHCYLKKPVRSSELRDCGVEGPYQTIRTLPEVAYRELFHPRLPLVVSDGGLSISNM